METRKTLLALGLAVLLLLSGCGKKEDSTTGQDAGTILRVMLGALEEREEKDALLWYLEPEEVEPAFALHLYLCYPRLLYHSTCTSVNYLKSIQN